MLFILMICVAGQCEPASRPVSIDHCHIAMSVIESYPGKRAYCAPYGILQ